MLPGLPKGCTAGLVSRAAKAGGLHVDALPEGECLPVAWSLHKDVISCVTSSDSCPLDSSTEDVPHRPQEHADLWTTPQRGSTLHPPEESPLSPKWWP